MRDDAQVQRIRGGGGGQTARARGYRKLARDAGVEEGSAEWTGGNSSVHDPARLDGHESRRARIDGKVGRRENESVQLAVESARAGNLTAVIDAGCPVERPAGTRGDLSVEVDHAAASRVEERPHSPRNPDHLSRIVNAEHIGESVSGQGTEIRHAGAVQKKPAPHSVRDVTARNLAAIVDRVAFVLYPRDRRQQSHPRFGGVEESMPPLLAVGGIAGHVP